MFLRSHPADEKYIQYMSRGTLAKPEIGRRRPVPSHPIPFCSDLVPQMTKPNSMWHQDARIRDSRLESAHNTMATTSQPDSTMDSIRDGRRDTEHGARRTFKHSASNRGSGSLAHTYVHTYIYCTPSSHDKNSSSHTREHNHLNRAKR